MWHRVFELFVVYAISRQVNLTEIRILRTLDVLLILARAILFLACIYLALFVVDKQLYWQTSSFWVEFQVTGLVASVGKRTSKFEIT